MQVAKRWRREAADRIEALTAKVAELEACLERQGSGHREDLDEIANVSVERLRRAKAAEAERDRLRAALQFGFDLIDGDSFGSEWKRGCHDFKMKARAALNGETP
jgi:hypothetical protein